ncbi:MAG: 4-oxalocrotonate tautomerase family protein [Agitococcus sp.]|nr:4-oxalocrotonate tautomerase family protein [Agitococcus sp.]
MHPDDFTAKEKSIMPYVNIKITREGATAEQKAELIAGVTDLLVRVLNKNPATTVVVIDEVDTDNWGISGQSVTKLRQLPAK